MELLLQTLFNSLYASSFFALTAVGLVLIFGVMGIINFAHGELYMVGAYSLWYLQAVLKWPFFFALIGAFVVAILIGFLMERFLFRPMANNPLGGLINSIGLLFILQVAAVMVGGVGLMKNVPPLFKGSYEVMAGVFLSKQRLFVTLVVIVVLFLVWLFLTRTKLGWALRAVSQDKEAAMLQGVNIHFISLLAVVTGVTLAALAGVLAAPSARVEPYMGHSVIISAFIVTIVGGIGSLFGAVLASIVYGFFHTFVTTFFGGVAAAISGLLLMLVVLVIKPTGLIGVQASQ